MILDHLHLSHSSGKTQCLWCGNDSLSMELETPNVFQCFKCKASGNAFTFLREYYASLPSITPAEARLLSTIKRGVQPTTIRDVGIRCVDKRYHIPLFNLSNELVSLHIFSQSDNIVYNGPKPVSYSAIGMHTFDSKKDTVYIAEGHWDYLTLLPLIPEDFILLGSCGSFFPSNLLQHFKDKHVVMLFDNDEAGKNGVMYVARILKSNGIAVHSLSFLDWSKITIPTGTVPDKFDVRDLYNVVS